jgi:hypothetical protein
MARVADTGRERDGARTSFVVDRSKLPPLYPTHLHDAAFWCGLGRAVATFGFLEAMLKGAVFALTGTIPAPEDEAARVAAVEGWHGKLVQSIANPLNPLIDTFGKAARHHPESRRQNLNEFVAALRAAARALKAHAHPATCASWDRGRREAAREAGCRVIRDATPPTRDGLQLFQGDTERRRVDFLSGLIPAVHRLGGRSPRQA